MSNFLYFPTGVTIYSLVLCLILGSELYFSPPVLIFFLSVFALAHSGEKKQKPKTKTKKAYENKQ